MHGTFVDSHWWNPRGENPENSEEEEIWSLYVESQNGRRLLRTSICGGNQLETEWNNELINKSLNVFISEDLVGPSLLWTALCEMMTPLKWKDSLEYVIRHFFWGWECTPCFAKDARFHSQFVFFCFQILGTKVSEKPPFVHGDAVAMVARLPSNTKGEITSCGTLEQKPSRSRQP